MQDKYCGQIWFFLVIALEYSQQRDAQTDGWTNRFRVLLRPRKFIEFQTKTRILNKILILYKISLKKSLIFYKINFNFYSLRKMSIEF